MVSIAAAAPATAPEGAPPISDATLMQPPAAADQTTLVQNEDMEFALQPIVDVTGKKATDDSRRKP